jgi:hypothetical protein
MARPGDYGSFTNTTSVWDPSYIYDSNLDPQLKEILVRMHQNLNRMAFVVNSKRTGIYINLFEFVNSEQWFPNPNTNSSTSTAPAQRQGYTTTINYPLALPNAGTVAIPHGIQFNQFMSFTRIYATATNPTGLTAIPLPFADAAGNNIQLDVDANNVNITTTSDRTAYTQTYIVLEYLKQ